SPMSTLADASTSCMTSAPPSCDDLAGERGAEQLPDDRGRGVADEHDVGEARADIRDPADERPAAADDDHAGGQAVIGAPVDHDRTPRLARLARDDRHRERLVVEAV